MTYFCTWISQEPFGAGCSQTILEVCEGTTVWRYGCACKDKNQPPVWRVSRHAGNGSSTPSCHKRGRVTQRSKQINIVTHCHVAGSKKASNSSPQLAVLLFGLSVQVYFHMPTVSPGQNRDVNKTHLQSGYLSWVTFSCFPDFTLMLLCSSSAADSCS